MEMKPLSTRNPGAAGTAYFIDGHTEVITHYRNMGGKIHFTTDKGGRYIYSQRFDLVPNALSLLGYSIIRVPYFLKRELVFVDNPYPDGTIRGEVHHRNVFIDHIEKIVLSDL